MIRIIGSFVSPYVRKVLAAINLKGLAYEVDPITPFYGNDEFERLSPLRRIPVLIDGDFNACDFSVICGYLDETYPGHPLFPADSKDRARARWFEEYADTRLAICSSGACSTRRSSALWSGASPATKRELQSRSTRTFLPHSTIWSASCPANSFLFGDIGVADIAIATFFRNGAYAGFDTDAARWPRTAAFVDRTLGHCLRNC